MRGPYSCGQRTHLHTWPPYTMTFQLSTDPVYEYINCCVFRNKLIPDYPPLLSDHLHDIHWCYYGPVRHGAPTWQFDPNVSTTNFLNQIFFTSVAFYPKSRRTVYPIQSHLILTQNLGENSTQKSKTQNKYGCQNLWHLDLLHWPWAKEGRKELKILDKQPPCTEDIRQKTVHR